MFAQPVTFLAELDPHDAVKRALTLHDFAVAGAKHIVLSEAMIAACTANSNMILELKKELANEGLDFVDSHAIFGRYNDMNCPDPSLFKVMIQMHRTALEICSAFSVDTICIHLGNNVWGQAGKYYSAPESEITHCLERNYRALDALLPLAEELGITICIENIWFENNTPERLLEFKKRYPTRALGFCYDSGHANLMKMDRGVENCAPKIAWGIHGKEVPWDDSILEKILDDVVICHLHGNDGLFDRHCNICDCDIDWKDICEKLHRAPRLKSIQSEVIASRCMAAASEIVNAFNRLII